METIKNIELLKIPESIQKDLNDFLKQLLELYSEDLVSIMAFGSSVTGDYVENKSDINLMVVYSDLNITDLNTVAKLARNWLKKRAFSPRFISMNNLTNSSRIFQIDMLEMKDMHLMLYGKNLFDSIAIDKKGIHWQLSYEIKAMRMRIKQQFWRSAGDEQTMQRILLERFTSITHLTRALLFLMDKPMPVKFDEILAKGAQELAFPSSYIEKMQGIKNKTLKPSNKELVQLFTETMDVIRILDKKTDQIAL